MSSRLIYGQPPHTPTYLSCCFNTKKIPIMLPSIPPFFLWPYYAECHASIMDTWYEPKGVTVGPKTLATDGDTSFTLKNSSACLKPHV